VFAVVQDQNDVAVDEPAHEDVPWMVRGRPSLDADPDRVGDGLDEQFWLRHGSKAHQPDAVRRLARELPAGLDSQRGLPRATRPDERDEPETRQQFPAPGDLALPADERREPQGKVPGVRRFPSRRCPGEVRGWPWTGHLGRDRRIVPQDLLHDRPQLARRIQPQLLGQGMPRTPVHLERRRLAASVEERSHELTDQPFAGGSSGDERLEVRDDLFVTAERQHPFGTLADGRQPQLGQLR
jgi:hypothetical protein